MGMFLSLTNKPFPAQFKTKFHGLDLPGVFMGTSTLQSKTHHSKFQSLGQLTWALGVQNSRVAVQTWAGGQDLRPSSLTEFLSPGSSPHLNIGTVVLSPESPSSESRFCRPFCRVDIPFAPFEAPVFFKGRRGDVLWAHIDVMTGTFYD